MKEKSVRVVVVDDSPTMRRLLVAMLENNGQIQVVGVGENGEDAVRLAHRMRPDALAIDITMPRMDGLAATRRIMREVPTPIVLISGSRDSRDAQFAFDAMQQGALAVIDKPDMENTSAWDELIRTLLLMSKVPVVRRWAPDRPVLPSQPALPSLPQTGYQIVGITASTGGPAALNAILGALPETFPIPVLIVQHVTRGFVTGLVDWLNTQTALDVRLAVQGEAPQPGSALLAPDDFHLQIDSQGQIELTKDAPYKNFRPSGNALFHSLARTYGPCAIGIELTGMGDDGVEGLLALHRAGGKTVAQNQASCAVYGMPREAVLQQAVDEVLPPLQIGEWLTRITGGKNRESFPGKPKNG